MTIPVTFPNAPFAITNTQNASAEAILEAFCQLVEAGTSGAAITTPPLLIPDPNNPGSVIPLDMKTSGQQLFYRHLFIAIAYYISSAPPPPAPSGTVQEIRFVIDTDASQSSTTLIPADAVIEYAELNIETAYDGGTTISVGQLGLPEILAGPLDNLATTEGRYGLSLDVPWGGTPLAVLVTVAGAPSLGGGYCVVRYSVPNS